MKKKEARNEIRRGVEEGERNAMTFSKRTKRKNRKTQIHGVKDQKTTSRAPQSEGPLYQVEGGKNEPSAPLVERPDLPKNSRCQGRQGQVEGKWKKWKGEANQSLIPKNGRNQQKVTTKVT